MLNHYIKQISLKMRSSVKNMTRGVGVGVIASYCMDASLLINCTLANAEYVVLKQLTTELQRETLVDENAEEN